MGTASDGAFVFLLWILNTFIFLPLLRAPLFFRNQAKFLGSLQQCEPHHAPPPRNSLLRSSDVDSGHSETMVWRCEAAKERAETQALALLRRVISCISDSGVSTLIHVSWSVFVHICWLFFLILYPFSIYIGFPDGSAVKNQLARRETKESQV